ADVQLDYAVVTLRSLADKHFLIPAVETFADVVTLPNFPEPQVTRIKKQIVNALQAEQQQPGSIVEKAFLKALYNGEPYGNPALGTLQTVPKLDKSDVQRFYQRYYVAANAHVVLVGDLSRNDAMKIAEQIVNKLPKGTAAKSLVSSQFLAKPEIENIRFPSGQTHVLIGQRAIARSSPDYFPLYVGNHILGGGAMTSRLFESVREKEGLAYSVNSYFYPLQQPGPFLVSLQTRNKEATRAIQIARKTLQNFVETGPTDSELIATKNNIVNGFSLRLASNFAIFQNVIHLTTYQLPLNYLDTYCDNIKSVTKENVKTAFHNVINTNKLVTVTVGNSIY
ncbi:MAG: insulinase family protein, partial [Pseudomonadota bacterium]|nr:insulinase family protein [Pseudomonadota bacterium]